MGVVKDKLTQHHLFTDKETSHTYGESYDELFKKRLKKKNVILEIGVEQGGSIATWGECFPNSRVIGVDITLKNFMYDLEKLPNVTLIESDINTLELDDKLDIVIDDGSHILSDVLAGFKLLYPKLKKGGVYIIEDCQDIDVWEKAIKDLVLSKDRFWSIDLRKEKGQFDDYLIIIEKK